MSAFRFCEEEKAGLIASEDESMHFRVCMSTLGVAHLMGNLNLRKIQLL